MKQSTKARRLAARVSPAGLGLYDMGRRRFQFPPHLQVLDRALCDVAAGRIKRLIIEMPPRHGKSKETSEYFPAWFLGKWPDKRVALASYGSELACDLSASARDIMIAHGREVFGVQVNPKKSASHNWGILGRRGGMIAVGVGGPLTGRGADVLIIDDPVKNHEEAQSKTHREKVWNWYTSTAYTRLEPDGAVIIIQTRWHEDDLAGRAQLQEDEEWTVIRMPATCDDPESDPLGREMGAALWPKRFNRERLAAIAKSVGSFVWNALYQQRPVAAEGNVLRKAWWREYSELPERIAETCDQIIQSWDLAFKDSEGADRVAGQVWGRRGADIFLLAATAQVLNFPDTCTAIRAMTARWPAATVKLIEDKANGPAVISTLRSEIGGLIPVEPQGGKMARVVAISGLVEAGNVYLPARAPAPWVSDFIVECAAFPNGTNDDQVDAMSQALIRLKPGLEPVAGANPWKGNSNAGSDADKRASNRRERREAAYWGSEDPEGES